MRILVLHARHLLVLRLKIELHNQEARQAQHLKPNTDTQRRPIVRLRAGKVREWCPDRRRVANGIDESQRRGSLGGWARYGSRDPSVDSAVLGEDEVHEEEGEVARSEAVGEHEDQKASDRYKDWVCEKPEAFAQVVGQVAVAKRVEDHEDVRWRDKEKRDDPTVAQRLRKGGEEVLEAC